MSLLVIIFTMMASGFSLRIQLAHGTQWPGAVQVIPALVQISWCRQLKTHLISVCAVWFSRGPVLIGEWSRDTSIGLPDKVVSATNLSAALTTCPVSLTSAQD